MENKDRAGNPACNNSLPSMLELGVRGWLVGWGKMTGVLLLVKENYDVASPFTFTKTQFPFINCDFNPPYPTS